MAQETEPEDLIRYDILAQEALRGVVKKVLQEVARTGLPGDHHFYVTLDTTAPGVRMSNRMREKHPEDLTIVIQHQFWDLETSDSGFSIGLSFDSIPETLAVPYSAIRGFFDPSVQFGLQFEDTDQEEEEIATLEGPEKVEALPSPDAGGKATRKDKPTAESDDDAADDTEQGTADVVSLDAFRKK